MMSLIAGKNTTTIAVIVLGVGLISYFVTQYIQGAERDKIELRIKDETNEVRQKIKEAVSTPPTNRDNATDSLQYLRDR